MSSTVIYLDHAAATPLDERVFLAMQPYFSDCFYNPSASYRGGREARQALETARETVAKVLGAKPQEVIFTAGATESVNLAIRGVMQGGGHAVIGATEHAAVRESVKAYPYTVARCDERGVVSVEMIEQAVRDDTVLISVTMADNELGTVQPISDIARYVATVRSARRASGNTTPLYLHSDGSQAATALDVTVSRVGVDMLTLSAAKCYGPKQMGLLWVKSSVRLEPLIAGGGQERGLRSGTENVAAAVGFAQALQHAQAHRHGENERLSTLRDILVQGLTERVEGLVVDGHAKRHLPGHLHVHVPRLDAERVVFQLDLQGVYAATGAACAANKQTSSPTLEAIGMTSDQANGSLRFTLGRLNNEEQIRAALPLIAEAIKKERAL